MAIIDTTDSRRRVIDASDVARAAGVRVGMVLAEARARCPGLLDHLHDPSGDRCTLEALGRWMTRFTPVVATRWGDDIGVSPPLLLLDITGTERLFGSTASVVGRVTRALARFDLPAATAVAPTIGAAWALASSDGQGECVDLECPDLDALPRRLSPLPVDALRLGEETLATLHHLGLHTIGQVSALPRDELPSRFGPTLTTRLDQALGVRPEVLVPLDYEVPVVARMELEEPVASLEVITAIFETLLRQIVEDLSRRGHGARRLELAGKSDREVRQPLMIKQIPLSRPTRDFATLFNLVRCSVERSDGGERGFTWFEVKVPVHEPLADVQASLVDDPASATSIEWDRLVERLGVRLGESAVILPMLVESYLPERAWRPADGGPVRARRARDDPSEPRVISARPLHLLRVPDEVQVISEPSDLRIGRPRQFTWRGEIYRLAHVAGPERIAGEWWRGHHRTRDYYEVEDTSGLRFWLFRVLQPLPPHPQGQGQGPKGRVRWFLHGRFV